MERNTNPLIVKAWAENASVETAVDIPQTQQQHGRASWALGIPEECFRPLDAGGSNVWGADINGAIRTCSRSIRRLEAGKPVVWSQDLMNAIGGYPQSCTPIVHNGSYWVSLVDNNFDEPSNYSNNWESYGKFLEKEILRGNVSQAMNVPVGCVLDYMLPAETVPTGFLLLYGQQINPEEYPLIQYIFQQKDDGNYYLPDCSNIHTCGSTISGDDALGKIFGDYKLTSYTEDALRDMTQTDETFLNSNHIPSHTHTLNNNSSQGDYFALEGMHRAEDSHGYYPLLAPIKQNGDDPTSDGDQYYDHALGGNHTPNTLMSGFSGLSSFGGNPNKNNQTDGHYHTFNNGGSLGHAHVYYPNEQISRLMVHKIIRAF